MIKYVLLCIAALANFSHADSQLGANNSHVDKYLSDGTYRYIEPMRDCREDGDPAWTKTAFRCRAISRDKFPEYLAVSIIDDDRRPVIVAIHRAIWIKDKGVFAYEPHVKFERREGVMIAAFESVYAKKALAEGGKRK